MDQYGDSEKQIIKNLAEYAEGKSLSLETFLKKYYLQESLNKGLIIQSLRKYAVLFLKTEQFHNELEKTNEINTFFEILSVLKSLVQNNIIHIFREKTENFYFIQDEFEEAKVLNNGTVILNSKGYYSSVPDTIYDSAKNEIYKGIQFTGEQFQIISNYCVGSFTVSGNLKALVSESSGTPVPFNHIEQHEEKREGVHNNFLDEKINAYSTKLQTMETKSPTVATSDSNNNLKDKTQVIMDEKIPSNQVSQTNKKTEKTYWLQLLSFILILVFFITCLLLTFFCHNKVNNLSKKLDTIINNTNGIHDSIQLIGRNIENVKQNHQTLSNQLSGNYGAFYGIDISKWNGNEVTAILKKDSISFIICKATEGTKYVDTEFSKNWDFIKQYNYLIGVYHFYRCDEDPIKQAEHFFNVFNNKGIPDIAPVIDIEQGSLKNPDPKGSAKIQSDLIQFLNYIESKTKRIPIIYTGLAFADEYLKNSKLSRYPLWLAEYTNAVTPRIPQTWKDTGYLIWQKRDNYFIDSHRTDFDVFYGKKTDLCK